MSLSLPEYDDVADFLANLRVMRQPEELHGYISGVLAAGLRPDEERWREVCTGFLQSGELDAEDVEMLRELTEATAYQMASEALDFRMLQPDDALELYSRIAALGGWCESFLTGFAFGGKEMQQLEGAREFGAEVSETLSDILAIANIGVEGDEDNESEADLFEVSEYVRIAVAGLYADCNVSADESPDDLKLH